jgi:hypothetical protein
METKETTRATTPQEKEVMEFLNTLRDSGVTNMFGAAPYIVDEFGYDKGEARRMLTLWMNNFNEDGNYETVKLDK